MFALQFKPLNAFSHYERAHRYRPDDTKYARAYALTLQNQNRYTDAEPIYQKTIKMLHSLATTAPSTYLPDVALTLNHLGWLYSHTQRPNEALFVLLEALAICRQLAKTKSSAYLSHVATVLDNLGKRYRDTQSLQAAEQAYQKALTIRRRLANTNPAA